MRMPVLLPALGASASFAGFLLVGKTVAHAAPGGLDRAGAALAGHGTAIAAVLTDAGLFPVYLLLCVALLLGAILRRQGLGDAVLAVATLLATWRISDLFKAYFARPRPPYEIGHEASFSYASGHAALALTFYGFWAVVLATSRLEPGRKYAASAVLAGLVLAIGWSRLSLGAHYATDVLGGYLLGVSGVLVAVAVRYAMKVASSERGKYLRGPRVEPTLRRRYLR